MGDIFTTVSSGITYRTYTPSACCGAVNYGDRQAIVLETFRAYFVTVRVCGGGRSVRVFLIVASRQRKASYRRQVLYCTAAILALSVSQKFQRNARADCSGLQCPLVAQHECMDMNCCTIARNAAIPRQHLRNFRHIFLRAAMLLSGSS